MMINEVPELAKIVAGNGGLTKVLIRAAAADGEMYLHGGHVTSWKPRGRDEVLYLSPRSEFQAGRAIRGGVPVCFPWFGNKADDPKAPAHGLVRNEAWELESVTQAGEAVTVSMVVESDDRTRQWWPGDFRLIHRVTFGFELTLELVMTNLGTAPLRFEEALHSYFSVEDCRTARVNGLDGMTYIDKTDCFCRKTQQGDVVIKGETDRVYVPATSAVNLEDPGMGRRIRVTKENSGTTVIWNPWVTQSKAMRDLGEDEYLRMICVEVANAGEVAVELSPGQRHAMRSTIGIEDY
jgi:glucose-6-phosphate 1-epimerase